MRVIGESGSDGSGKTDPLKIYLDEMALMQPFAEGEAERLLRLAAAGDAQARKRLIEGNLRTAVQEVRPFLGKELSVGELIGEANLALVSAVDAYTGNGTGAALTGSGNADGGGTRELTEKGLREAIAASVREALSLASEAENAYGQGSAALADRLNLLSDAASSLAASLGREPKEEELAERLGIGAEEVRELLKLSIRAMES